MNKLFYLGTEDIKDDLFKSKIILTNQLAIIFFFITTSYSIILPFFADGLAMVYFAGTVLICSVWVFNYIGWFDISRLILVLASSAIAFYSNIIISKAGETPNVGITLAQLSISIIPFVLINFKETFLFAISVAICVTFLFLIEPAVGWVEVGNFIDVFRSPLFDNIFIAIAILTGGGLVLILQNINAKSENYSKNLLEMMHLKNKEQQNDKEKLDQYIHEIQKTQLEEKQRTWASEGLSLFVDILRSNNDNVEMLYNDIISNLVKYIKANQGGLFIVNTQEKVSIDLAAAYAYNKKKFIKKQIMEGEGLIGQCYLEKEIMLLTEIPANYMQITSGLGDALPRCIVIIPLIYSEKVLGIIEIATFTPFNPFEIEFLKKLSESVAGTIANVKVNDQTRKLLEASQQQSEMLRSQEEEMRQNMEELQATQEEMMIKSTEFKEFSDVINLFTILIDLSPDGLIMNVNDKFSEVFGYPKNEIIGKKHTYYVPEEAIVSGAFEKLWQELLMGENIVRDVLRMKKDGARFWLRASYMPMLDKNGKMSKIRCLCFDINKQKNEEENLKMEMAQLKLKIETLTKKS